MIYAITLHDRVTKNEREAYLDYHKKWLAGYIQSGQILFAGPLDNDSGGFILARFEHDAAVTAALAQDPFVSNALVSVTLQAVTPAICSDLFPISWRSSAKVIPSLN
ncbi:YciI family protein [Dickeya lacustris]|uniref:YciI family protein n=1 Tax=Dickeya lacustris TaxID=2259638 RepID=A0ABY8GAZ2_9GAMM|nr:YciI family protein [Dickeya lacustris]WFN57024.1 YciI family protein [Dickeya lacustris]